MVRLWLRCEVFDFGLVPFPVQARVDFGTLYELAATLRQTELAKQGKLKYSDWISSAKSCLNLNEAQASLYYELFDTIQQTMATAVLQRSREELSSPGGKPFQPIVPLYEFLLFLFIQLYSKGSPRPRKMEDVWPEARGGSPRSPMSSTRGDETLYLTFVKRHLVEMLHLLLSDGAASTVLSKTQLDRLGFIIGGGPHFRSETAFLSSLTSFWDAGSRMVPVTEISDWLNSNLTVNSYLYPATVPSSPMTRPGSADEFMEGEPTVPKPTIIANVHKRTIVKGDSEVHGGMVRIMHCNNSVIYVLASCKYALISNCINCIVFVGAAQHVLYVDRCERTKVIAAARTVRVGSSRECTLNLCCNTSPIMTGTNNEIVLGPYNSSYPKLETHLQQAAVNPFLSRWDQFVVAWNPVHPQPSDEMFGRGVKLMTPEQFMPFAVPFSIKGPTVSNPCKLPAVFTEAMKKKARAIQDMRETVARLKTDESVQRDVQAVVEGQFKEWLASSGNIRQVYDLLRITPEL